MNDDVRRENQNMFFVSGITGKVGGAAASGTGARGAAEWSERGVDVRQGDFNDAATVAPAPVFAQARTARNSI